MGPGRLRSKQRSRKSLALWKYVSARARVHVCVKDKFYSWSGADRLTSKRRSRVFLARSLAVCVLACVRAFRLQSFSCVFTSVGMRARMRACLRICVFFSVVISMIEVLCYSKVRLCACSAQRRSTWSEHVARESWLLDDDSESNDD